jgi:hypothetical protein|tara:strand:- start:4865 stop:5062 length:198 start_codon:yes stop_codon:yes gene_type:complete
LKILQNIIKAIVVLVPTYLVAYYTELMIYTVPMLAAMSFIAAGLFLSDQTTKRRVDEDAHPHKDE